VTPNTLDLDGTGGWLQARLGKNVWVSVAAGTPRPVVTGQGELRYEPGYLGIQHRMAEDAEAGRADWHKLLLFHIGPAFRLYIGDNFRSATEQAGVLRIVLDGAEVTLTDDFWALFPPEVAGL
jgi:hypothetical protein